MSRLSLFIVLIIFTGLVGSFLFFQNLSIYLPQTETPAEEQALTSPETETQADEQTADLIEEVEEEISVPLPAIEIPPVETQVEEQIVEEQISAPLVTEEETIDSLLTQSGIIQWTNVQREQSGLPLLRENPKLNASAQEKMQDMFAGQYFAHVSPSGVEVSDLAKVFSYQFITIGENLARGNFQNDQVLVQAWMDSPGHRANILNAKYQEIGVAVGQGIFEGQVTWIAVQHFALPLSACAQPDKALLAEIEENQQQSEELLATLIALQNEIQAMRPKRGPIYQQKVTEYNNLVSQYNALIEETKDLVEQYNTQVQLFNQCAS